MMTEAKNRPIYENLMEIAASRQIRVVEVAETSGKDGMRFHLEGQDWIAINSDLSINEKIRSLGFLLEDAQTGQGQASEGSNRVVTLQCPVTDLGIM
jgi:hypothetical protein